MKTRKKATKAMRRLMHAYDALEHARLATTEGFADDHCANALRELRKAIQVQVERVTEAPE